jgi:hypothetical protein
MILLGLWFLALQLVPGLSAWLEATTSWPLIVIAMGLVLLLIALVANAPALAIPASIVGGIGIVLYFQNLMGNWQSWAYAWTLIPGFVGVGIVLRGLIGGQPLREMQGALWLILISAVMFTLAAAFVGVVGFAGVYWPFLLIVFGVLLLLRPLFRTR